jgi:hypothetical protein
MSLSRISDSLVHWGQSSGFPIEKVSFESWLSGYDVSEDLENMFPRQDIHTSALAIERKSRWTRRPIVRVFGGALGGPNLRASNSIL